MEHFNSSTHTPNEEAGPEEPAAATHEPVSYRFKMDEVRTLRIGDGVWFSAPDVCDILGLTNPSQSLSRLMPAEKLVADLYSSGQIRQTTMVDESGLIALVLTSRKPDAIEFRRWITNDVLPSIWKTGSYTSSRHGAAQEHSDIADIINRRPGIYIVIVNKNGRRVQHTNGGEVVTLVTEAMSNMMAGALISAQGALTILQSETLVVEADQGVALQELEASINRGVKVAGRYVAMRHRRTADAEIPPVEVPR